MLDRLIGIATVGSTLAGVGLLRRFLQKMMSIIFLTIVSAFLFCVMLAGVLYLLYFSLLQYGIAAPIAGMIMVIISMIAALSCGAGALYIARQLREQNSRDTGGHKNNWLDIEAVAHAFIEGFINSGK